MNAEEKEQIKKMIADEIYSDVGKLLMPIAMAIGDVKEKVTILADNKSLHP